MNERTDEAVPAGGGVGDAVHCVWPGGAALGEGALWSPGEGRLYWVDILGCRVHRLDPASGRVWSWTHAEQVSALAERRDAPGLAVALRRGLALWHPDEPAGSPRYLCRPEPERAGNRFNDGKCDAQGRFWLGSMDLAGHAPTGALYRIDGGGQAVRMEDGVAISNGPAWIDDGRTLLFNDTAGACVLAYEFDAAAGEISGRRVWARFAAGDGVPDGMATDAEGRVWICHWGGGCVTCHDPRDARELMRLRLPVSQVTSCAFGGEDLRTLYVTSARVGLDARALAQQPLAGGLFAVRLPVAGRPAHRFAG